MKSKNKTAAKEDELVEFDMSKKEMARIYESSMETIGKKKFVKKRDQTDYKEEKWNYKTH